MIVWDLEPNEYANFSGRMPSINADVSVECVRDGVWSYHAWNQYGILAFRSDHFYPTPDAAKRAAEVWASTGKDLR